MPFATVNFQPTAQLSQRDRATAAFVSLGQNITGRQYSANIIDPSSTTVT